MLRTVPAAKILWKRMLQQLRLLANDCAESLLISHNSAIRRRAREVLVQLITPVLALVMISHPAFSQTASVLAPIGAPAVSRAFTLGDFASFSANVADAPAASEGSNDPSSRTESRGA